MTSDVVRLSNDTVCFAALAMLHTFDDPDSTIVDLDKVLTTAIVSHKLYNTFLLELQPVFDKKVPEDEYQQYVKT